MWAANGHFYDPVGFPCPPSVGVGHRVNHPPRGAPPTVLSWPSRVRDPDLLTRLPNEYVDAAAVGACLPLLALADVATGDELFMDYRYELGLDDAERAELPDWYVSVSSGAPRSEEFSERTARAP